MATGCAIPILPLSLHLSGYAGGTRTASTWCVVSVCGSIGLLNTSLQEDDWRSKVSNILRFARQLIAILATQVEAPSIALRLFLLAAQIADECGFEDLAYDLYVSAFTVYEDSISESRAQLQAITLIIGTLQGARVFSEDNYDTLITKAALHGARLLKKPHQATAVNLASHLWWQDIPPDEEVPAKEPQPTTPAEDGAENVKKAVRDILGTSSIESSPPRQYPHQDSKRVLECLQKALRIASSAIEEIVTVQLYCDTLDQYLYYLDRGAPAVRSAHRTRVPCIDPFLLQVTPKFVNSLVELITSSIDNISSPDVHPSQRAPPGLLEGVQTPDMITRHFRNTLIYIQAKKNAASSAEGGSAASRWDDVDVVGALLKMNIGAR